MTLVLVGCGNSGDPAVCNEARQPCSDAMHVHALEVYSVQGCSGAINSWWCGVEAQRLAECLYSASVCIEINQARDAIKAALAASECAKAFEEWDDCFANGEAGGGDGDGDFDE